MAESSMRTAHRGENEADGDIQDVKLYMAHLLSGTGRKEAGLEKCSARAALLGHSLIGIALNLEFSFSPALCHPNSKTGAALGSGSPKPMAVNGHGEEGVKLNFKQLLNVPSSAEESQLPWGQGTGRAWASPATSGAGSLWGTALMSVTSSPSTGTAWIISGKGHFQPFLGCSASVTCL